MPATAAAAVRTVIVADDTAFVRDRFRAALESAGHRALTVGSSAELVACVRAERHPIDLVVLDLRLPKTRGAELVHALHAIDGARPPIVVFSGTIASADEVRELDRLGIAGYVNEYAAERHIMPSLAPHLFPDTVNRRASPRVTLGVPISYRVGHTIAAAITLSISSGGLAIRTRSPLELGAHVKTRFGLPDSADIDAEARVVWTDRQIGMGLQFTSIAPHHQAAIDDFVRGRFFSNRKA